MEKLKELTGFDLEGIWKEEERKRQGEGNNKSINDSFSYIPYLPYEIVAIRYYTSGAYRSVFLFTFFTGAGGYTAATDGVIASGSEIIYI